MKGICQEMYKLLAIMQAGDTLVFIKLDRIAKSVTQGIFNTVMPGFLAEYVVK